jgi:hypothetical protein
MWLMLSHRFGPIDVRIDADLQEPEPVDFNGFATVTHDEDSQ